MEEYFRQKGPAVCTNQEARDYFRKERGLTYDDVGEGDILILCMLLQREYKKSAKARETSSDMELSKKTEIRKKTNGKIKSCFLFVNSSYFTQRECVSFNEDGFIGFAGWADQENTNPILRAFLQWCDYLAEAKADAEKAG